MLAEPPVCRLCRGDGYVWMQVPSILTAFAVPCPACNPSAPVSNSGGRGRTTTDRFSVQHRLVILSGK